MKFLITLGFLVLITMAVLGNDSVDSGDTSQNGGASAEAPAATPGGDASGEAPAASPGGGSSGEAPAAAPGGDASGEAPAATPGGGSTRETSVGAGNLGPYSGLIPAGDPSTNPGEPYEGRGCLRDHQCRNGNDDNN